MDALECLSTRRSVARLAEPAPDDDTLRRLLAAAVNAPDHGLLRPWRFLVLRGRARERLGDAFAAAHAAREPDAGEDAYSRTRRKPLRAPLLLAVIASPKPSAKIPAWEQEASAACVAYGVCLAAHALGWGAMWRTGWYGDAPLVRAHLGLAAHERMTGLLYVGRAADGTRPPPRTTVDVDALVTRL